MEYEQQKHQPPILAVSLIFLLELLFFLLLFLQESMGIMYLAVICGMILFYFYPEISLSLAFTGSVLFHVLYDYAHIQLPFFALIFGFGSLVLGALIYLDKNCYGKEIHFGKLFIISSAIAVLLMVGLIFSTNRSYGIDKTILFILINMPLIAIIPLYRDDLPAIQRILFFNIIIGLFLTVLSFIAARDSIQFGLFRFSLSENVGPLGVARPLTISIVSTFFFIANSKSHLMKAFVLSLIPFLLVPIIWSGSRGPLLSVFAAALTFVILQPRIGKYQKVLIFAALISGGIVFLLHSSNQVSERLVTPISEEASAAFRVLAWIQSVNDFLANPITGIGTGSFYLDTKFLPLVYPHNLVLELACENGIMGLLLILFFGGITVKYGFAAVKNLNEKHNIMALQLCIGICALFVSSWINSMVSGNIAANSAVWLSAGLIWILYLYSETGQVEY